MEYYILLRGVCLKEKIRITKATKFQRVEMAELRHEQILAMAILILMARATKIQPVHKNYQQKAALQPEGVHINSFSLDHLSGEGNKELKVKTKKPTNVVFPRHFLTQNGYLQINLSATDNLWSVERFTSP